MILDLPWIEFKSLVLDCDRSSASTLSIVAPKVAQAEYARIMIEARGSVAFGAPA
jgi:hypothetical protein